MKDVRRRLKLASDKELFRHHYIEKIPQGPERKWIILERLERFFGDVVFGAVYINNKHQIQLHQDKDLKYLLKKKLIKMIRLGHPPLIKKQTALVAANSRGKDVECIR